MPTQQHSMHAMPTCYQGVTPRYMIKKEDVKYHKLLQPIDLNSLQYIQNVAPSL